MLLIELALVIAPPLCQDVSPPQEVVLGHVPPAADVRATYSFSEESNVAVERLKSTMNGSAFEAESPDRAVKLRARRAWVDATVTGEAGPRLRRTFADVSASMEVTNLRTGTPQPDGIALGSSLLRGRAVEFEPSEEGFRAQLAGDGDAEVPTGSDVLPAGAMPHADLDALTRDCAPRALLPTKEDPTQVGETWRVDAAALLGVLAPGGEIETYYGAIQNQRDPDFLARFGGHALSRFGTGEACGAVEAQLVGVEERGALRVARIQLEFDVTLTRDPAAWMHTQSAPFEMAKIGQTAKAATHTMTAKGKATLLWDVDHHRFVEFTAKSETTSDQELDYGFEHMGTKFAGSEHFEFSGASTLRFSASYETE